MIKLNVDTIKPSLVTREGFAHAFVGKIIDATQSSEFRSRLFCIEKNGHTELHSHAHEQLHVIISGSAEYGDGKSFVAVEAGDVLLAQSDEPHIFRNNNDLPFVFVVIFTEKGEPRV